MSDFQMTVTGVIVSATPETEAIYLSCKDGTKLRVSLLTAQTTLPTVMVQHHVVPSTDSNGEITTVKIVESRVDAEPDSCSFTGRVIQLGKRNDTVLFKVALYKQKDLKITLLKRLPEMKAGQLWKVNAIRQGNYLYIQRAEPLEPLPSIQVNTVQNPPPADIKRIVMSNTLIEETHNQTLARMKLIAHLALDEKTGHSGWVLSVPVQRGQLWEWSAELTGEDGEPPLLARVRVNPLTQAVQIYQFPSTQSDKCSHGDVDVNSQPTHERLIVTPLGAARSIGASCFKVEIGPYEIVLDAGTRPKGSNPLPAFEHLQNPNLIVITHAHQDHIGALPVFQKRFPATPMICTAGTREIAHVMLTDCLRVQQSNEDFEQLFDEYDLEQTLFRLETQPVGKDFEPLPGLKVRFIHAGHIVGAACVYIRYGERSLLYTGDYNTTNSRTTEGLRLADLPTADMLITESTYGADTHPSRKSQEAELLQAVAEVVQRGGNVLIPAFALGRAQEIILAIRTSALFHNLNIPVYIDGLVRAVTDVFRDNIEFLPASVQNFAKQQEPFFDPKGTPPIIPISHKRERPLAIAKPSVIIASSGMLSGGASVYYGQALLERDNAAIFISGYTDEESPGRFLQGLNKGDTVVLEGKELTVRATVRRFNLSAHADRVGLTQVIHRVNPRHLILIHGSMDALHELARAGDLQEKYLIHIPEVGEAISYGDVPEHISSRQLAKIELPESFEVELVAEAEGGWLRIPESVLTDPRWLYLSKSGLLKATWDGIALKLIPQDADYLAKLEAAISSGSDCCAACQYFQRKRCSNAESPLFNRIVDPYGNCMEFQRENVNIERFN